MGVQFSVCYVLDRQVARAFARMREKRPFVRVCTAVICACAVILLVCGVLLLVSGASAPSAVLYLCFAVLLLLSRVFNVRLQAALILKGLSAAARDKPVTYDFSPDQFVARTALSAEALRYAIITEVWESDALFALFISKQRAYLLPKAAFTSGRPEDFVAFLAGRAGAAYRRV